MRSRNKKKRSFFFFADKQRFKGAMKCIHVMRLIYQQSFVEDSFLFLFFFGCVSKSRKEI